VFPPDLLAHAAALIEAARARGLKIAAAESCTGGLIVALLTEIPGSSAVVERGFVTYSNEAKSQMLGVSPALIAAHGAVSAEVAQAMALGALDHSAADVAIAITGIAGPGGGNAAKPVGLVFLACARRGSGLAAQQAHYGDAGRGAIRVAAVAQALAMLTEAVG
jgi:nicotinamide-nucleotide amidase